jgi:hypothetical protein
LAYGKDFYRGVWWKRRLLGTDGDCVGGRRIREGSLRHGELRYRQHSRQHEPIAAGRGTARSDVQHGKSITLDDAVAYLGPVATSDPDLTLAPAGRQQQVCAVHGNKDAMAPGRSPFRIQIDWHTQIKRTRAMESMRLIAARFVGERAVWREARGDTDQHA